MTHSLLLYTSRLTIVGINEINFSQLIQYYQENADHLMYGGGSVPRTDIQIRTTYDTWLNNIRNQNEVRFFLLLDEKLIGVVGISNIIRGAFHAAYLGYHIAESAQGKGYMTEALEEIILFAFTAMNLHRLMANYRPDNIASGRVLEKLDFVKEGLAKDYLLVDGIWADHVLTSLINPNWKPE
ncbi:MAG: GNAT family N-acetyltransferase [Reinekea sp.]|jgi:[ribosomal protein S5]-alanine N-acetyltransferase